MTSLPFHARRVPLRGVLSGLIIAAVTSAVIGCSANTGLSTAGNDTGNIAGTAALKLTAAQITAAEAGVRSMVPNATTAEFSNHSARTDARKPGIHVCGYVRYIDSDNLKTVEQPFYVELRDVNGKPNAERGQVGGDPSKLAKVRFLCREHSLR